MITIITGKRGSGKSSLVKKIVGGKKAVWVQQYALNGAFWTSEYEVKADTEFIIVDEVTEIEELKELFSDVLVIRERLKKDYRISMPQIIIVSQNALKVDISYTHINCDIFYSEVNGKMMGK